VDELIADVRKRGLQREIVRLFEQVPPEERRDVPAQTGYRLDMRNVAQTGGGRVGSNEDLFIQRRWTESGDKTVGVAIDLSGSVDADRARLALAGLAEATRVLGDTFVAVGFRDNPASLPLITGPREEFDPRHLTAISTGGSTPVAHGIREIRRLVKRTHDEVKLVFVITDGRPNVCLDSESDDSDASDHAYAQVEQTRNDDIIVVGVGVGSVYGMDDVFGPEGYVMADKKTLAEDLLEVYRNQVRTI
jgi:Mg-chelatase subunit ChlD